MYIILEKERWLSHIYKKPVQYLYAYAYTDVCIYKYMHTYICIYMSIYINNLFVVLLEKPAQSKCIAIVSVKES